MLASIDTHSLASRFQLPDTNSRLRRGYYVDIHNAADVLSKRHSLREAVEAWWIEQRWGLPPLPCFDQPENHFLGLISRNCATARFEDLVFWLLAQQAGLVPCWSTYTGDHMCASSPIKASYIAGKVVTGKNWKGEPLFQPHMWLKPVNRRDHKGAPTNQHPHHLWNGKPLREVVDLEGRRLVDILTTHQNEMIGSEPLRFDITDWYRKAGFHNSAEYYVALLSLCIAHGVLFEDFHGGESGDQLGAFTERVFQPAFHRLKMIFGVEPLVTPLPWWREMGYYPAHGLNWRECGAIPAECMLG